MSMNYDQIIHTLLSSLVRRDTTLSQYDDAAVFDRTSTYTKKTQRRGTTLAQLCCGQTRQLGDHSTLRAKRDLFPMRMKVYQIHENDVLFLMENISKDVS